MQGGALAGRDDEGGGAGAGGLGDLDLAGDTERLGDAGHCGERLGRGAALEIAAGHGDAQAADAGLQRRQRRLGRALGAHGVLGIVALHGVVGERQVPRGARQRPHVIEARHEREGAGAGEAAVGRLQAEDAAERGRHADRAVGVGAERDRHQPAGHRRARAARGAAGHMRGVVRVARGAVVHVLAGEVVGVLAHVERADEDGAGSLQPRDQRGVGGGGRAVAVDLGAGQRRQARPRRTGSSPRTARRRAAPAARPLARAASMARASPAPARAVTAVKALSALSRSAMRASAASTTSTAVRLPAATAAAISAADAQVSMRVTPRTRGPAPPRPAARTRQPSPPRAA